MGVMSTPIMPRQGNWTAADLAQTPDDGLRYELIDGSLIVTPSPTPSHQFAVMGLIRGLMGALPPALRLVSAPLDVYLGERTVVQPDLLVAGRDAFATDGLRVPPLLAVEVASPSTGLIDRNLKFASFEAAGVHSYWIIDPAGPSLTAWELCGDAYVQVAHVTGDESWTAALPFPVTIVPARLLD